MYDLVYAVILLLFGLPMIWLLAVSVKIWRCPPAVWERNRSRAGSFKDNFLGRNPKQLPDDWVQDVLD